jgi:hypothetical protein
MDGTSSTPALDLPPAPEPRLPVVAIRTSRGRTGGTTVSDLMVQLARKAGRKVLVVDADIRNATLSGLYPGDADLLRPVSDDPETVKELLTGALETAHASGSSVVIDVGGGDRVLEEYGAELALVEVCETLGLAPLAVYSTGPDEDDFDHIARIWEAGMFRPTRAILFMNEHLIPHGRKPSGAFGTIIARPELQAMIEHGLALVSLPRLPCMPEIRESGLGFFDAMAGKPGRSGRPLGPVRQFMVKHWLRQLDEGFAEAGVREWLP